MTDVYAGIPKFVRVGCYVFAVEIGEHADHESESTFGHTNFHSQKIRLRPGMNAQNLANTFLHEVIHAINWFHGLYDENTEEEFTTRGANGLCAFWQDNPDAVAWWYRTLQFRSEPK